MSNSKVVAASVLAAVLALSACKPAAVPVEDVRAVRTLTVGAAPSKSTITYAGEVRARSESALAFRVPGKIIARQVNIGDRVSAGQTLARLDATDLQLGDAAANAQVAAAQAQFKVTQGDLERVKRLVEKRYASQGELDRYTAQYEAAKAQLDAARAQRDQVANQASYSSLLADADGVITTVLAEAGQVVAAGQPVLHLARLGAVEIAAAIPEDQINFVQVGMPVAVSLWSGSGKTYPGQIRELSSAADPSTRTYAVRVAVPAPPAEMRLGMTASIAIALQGLPTRMHLPSPAMVTQQDRAGVWVVEPKSSAVTFRAVEFAGVEGNEVLVASGLVAGDVVVTAGAAFLREGQKVKLLGAVPVPAQPVSAATAG